MEYKYSVLCCKEGVFIKIHVCRAGESLSSLASFYKLPPEELSALNLLYRPPRLISGFALALPGAFSGETELCAEFPPSAPFSQLSSAAEGLSFLVCGRVNISPEGELYSESCFPALSSSGSALPLLAFSNISSEGCFSGRLAHEAMKDGESRKSLAVSLVKLAEEQGFQGIYTELCRLFPFDRERYIFFMEYLSALAHERGLFLLSALECEAEDFYAQRLCALCDRLILLSYDYNLSLPGPAAPLNLIRRDAERLTGLLPAAKLLISLSDRALDCSLSDKSLRSLSSARALKLALASSGSMAYDMKSACASFNYRSPSGAAHRVFTPDMRYAAAVAEFIDESGLAGVFFPRSETVFSPGLSAFLSSYRALKYI